MQWRIAYDGSDELYSRLTALTCDPKLDTVSQHAVNDADINELVRRFHITGDPPPAAAKASFYGDFSLVDDYASALQSLEEAQERFLALPSKVRSRFGNDPEQLLMFLEDPANREEAVTLGLIEAPLAEVTGTGTEKPPAGA